MDSNGNEANRQQGNKSNLYSLNPSTRSVAEALEPLLEGEYDSVVAIAFKGSMMEVISNKQTELQYIIGVLEAAKTTLIVNNPEPMN